MSSKKNIAKPEGYESRVMHTGKVEVREEGDGKVIEGVAAVVNSITDMGWFDEMVMPGAFDEVLDDDVRVLFNHDANKVLGRTKSGTAELYLTPKGDLGYRYTNPDRTYAADLYDCIRTGDVDQCSFGFRVKEAAWEYRENGEKDLRKIIKFERLYDVSPVTYPAYQDTSVAVRSYEENKEEREALEAERNGQVNEGMSVRSARLRIHQLNQ